MGDSTDGGRVLGIDAPHGVGADGELRHQLAPRLRADVPDPLVVAGIVEEVTDDRTKIGGRVEFRYEVA